MAKIKVVLRKNAQKKDGTYPIIINVTSGNERKTINTGYAVKENQFTEGSENWVHHHPDALLINANIENQRSALSKEILMANLEGKDVSVKALGEVKKEQTFFELFDMLLKLYIDRDQPYTFKSAITRYKNLKEAWGQDVNVSDLSAAWVDKYINFRKKKGKSQNAIKKDLCGFASVLKKFSDLPGKNWFTEAQSELRYIKTRKEKLTPDEIKVLENVTLYNNEALARDMFLFAYYSQGMRFTDVVLLKRSAIKKEAIEYRMSKSKKLREAGRHKKINEIIAHYSKAKTPFLFPIVEKEPTSNDEKAKYVAQAAGIITRALKKVAERCGIEKTLSMHIARHSFASIALKKGNARSDLKKMLGHDDYATTEGYLDDLSDKVVSDNLLATGMYD